ncbi:jg4712 [Pararge aegeria aegeria]|uniref:Jg4712 protein n=1 Tax=Pararge aegeria aegeria TaxID=348720 RepID=A0A8S4RGP6_9NEOP|nr:jg4712 [Pararge aegeria aegeria]
MLEWSGVQRAAERTNYAKMFSYLNAEASLPLDRFTREIVDEISVTFIRLKAQAQLFNRTDAAHHNLLYVLHFVDQLMAANLNAPLRE